MCARNRCRHTRYLRGALFLFALTFVLGGCTATTAPVAQLTSSHASLASGELLRLGALGIELATALHETEPTSLCPIISVDGDQTVLDYGGGCAPESGSTEEGISGQIYFTTAPSSGWFVGNFEGIGYSSHAISGQLSGSHSLEGDVSRFDLQFEGVERMDRDDLSFAGLFEIETQGDAFMVNVDGGLMTGPSGSDTEVIFSDIIVHNGALDSCVLPTAGSIELRRGSQQGLLNFSEDAADSGLIPFTLSGDESPPVLLCS
jgi:hypothetical protein